MVRNAKTFNSLILCAVVCTIFVLLPMPVEGQISDDLNSSPVPAAGLKTTNRSCSVFALQTASSLTLSQRGCYFVRQLLSPQFAVSTAAMGVFGQAMNRPFVRHDRWGKLPHRYEIYYARHAAMDAGEYLVGYFHHEDPRLHKSSQTTFWSRTSAALLSVVTSPGDDGHLRPAFAPVAGSLSSAFTGTLMYRHSETLPTTMAHAGGIYVFYFVRAVVAEFRPDIDSMVRRILHKS